MGDAGTWPACDEIDERLLRVISRGEDIFILFAFVDVPLPGPDNVDVPLHVYVQCHVTYHVHVTLHVYVFGRERPGKGGRWRGIGKHI
jgi:hypothetical protein